MSGEAQGAKLTAAQRAAQMDGAVQSGMSGLRAMLASRPGPGIPESASRAIGGAAPPQPAPAPARAEAPLPAPEDPPQAAPQPAPEPAAPPPLAEPSHRQAHAAAPSLSRNNGLSNDLARARALKPVERRDSAQLLADPDYLAQEIRRYRVRPGRPKQICVTDEAYQRVSVFSADHGIPRSKTLTFLLDAFLPKPTHGSKARRAAHRQLALMPHLFADSVQVPEWLGEGWPFGEPILDPLDLRIEIRVDPYLEWRFADMIEIGGIRNDIADRLIRHVFPRTPSRRIVVRAIHHR